MNPINKARELLVKQDITSFKLEIGQMKFDKGIYFDTFSGYAKSTGTPAVSRHEIKDGCTVIKTEPSGNEVYIILTHTQPPSWSVDSEAGRLKWTLAHEIGHVYLEHSKDGELEERQANRFAGELLVPELVVLELQRRLGRKLSLDEVSRLFGVSQSAAHVRLNQIGRKEFFSAYLKSEILGKFGELIESYASLKKNSQRGNSPDKGGLCPLDAGFASSRV